MSELAPKNVAAQAVTAYQGGDYATAARLFGEAAEFFFSR